MTTKEAIAHLVKTIRTDEGYRWGWQANIAVAFQDEWQRHLREHGLPYTIEQIHKISNNAADNFLFALCRPTDDATSTETNSIQFPNKFPLNTHDKHKG